MRTVLVFAALSLVLSLGTVAPAHGQGTDWRPPSPDMPMMPRDSELAGNWLQPRSAWFNGLEGVTGTTAASLTASGDRRRGSEYLQIARFGDGPVPVVVWSDRNGDDRADIIEIFRRGGMIIQVIDADYNGRANVMRVYNPDGSLLREDRL